MVTEWLSSWTGNESTKYCKDKGIKDEWGALECNSEWRKQDGKWKKKDVTKREEVEEEWNEVEERQEWKTKCKALSTHRYIYTWKVLIIIKKWEYY